MDRNAPVEGVGSGKRGRQQIVRTPSARWFEAAALATSLGFEFAAAVGVPCFAGYWIDRWLGWPPVGFTLLLGAAGAVAGFLMMVQTLRAFEGRGRKRDKTPE